MGSARKSRSFYNNIHTYLHTHMQTYIHADRQTVTVTVTMSKITAAAAAGEYHNIVTKPIYWRCEKVESPEISSLPVEWKHFDECTHFAHIISFSSSIVVFLSTNHSKSNHT